MGVGGGGSEREKDQTDRQTDGHRESRQKDGRTETDRDGRTDGQTEK